MKYYTDGKRHLVCKPYSKENLHKMAADLGIHYCWFHKDHYDIPKRRIAEIEAKCIMVGSKRIVSIKNGKDDHIEPVSVPQKKYSLIYGDPAWEFKNWSDKGSKRSAEKHYVTQSTDFMSRLDVKSISADDCTLLMWATLPCLPDAIKLGEAWGFTFKTVAFVWVKMNAKNYLPFQGMGYYTRSNSEICLLFTKGNPLTRKNKGVSQVIMEEELILTARGAHSQKPALARKRIEDLFGEIPRLEMFARTRPGMFGNDEYKNWDVWGNQVDNSIDIPCL